MIYLIYIGLVVPHQFFFALEFPCENSSIYSDNYQTQSAPRGWWRESHRSSELRTQRRRSGASVVKMGSASPRAVREMPRNQRWQWKGVERSLFLGEILEHFGESSVTGWLSLPCLITGWRILKGSKRVFYCSVGAVGIVSGWWFGTFFYFPIYWE